MGTYKLTVVYAEPNPDYRPPRDYGGFHMHSPAEGTPTINERVLDVLLTEEQWRAVQRAVLETFK